MILPLSCLLLPIRQGYLLLPSSAVSEIIAYEKPESVIEAPKWLLGILVWRSIHIPLTCLEQMCAHWEWDFDSKLIGLPRQSRPYIAIINRVKKAEPHPSSGFDFYPFFATLLQGIPDLKQLKADEVKIITQFSEKEKRFLMEVKAQENCAFIPDLESLWGMIDALPERLQWFRKMSAG